jgi:hypothetical protein
VIPSFELGSARTGRKNPNRQAIKLCPSAESAARHDAMQPPRGSQSAANPARLAASARLPDQKKFDQRVRSAPAARQGVILDTVRARQLIAAWAAADGFVHMRSN